jgi:GcrA cell cycle regulator
MIWPDDMIADLRRLWADGYSASQIGRAIGKTRNAVLGKAFRLHLPHRQIVFRTKGGAPRARSKRSMFNPPTPLRESIRDIIRDGTPIPPPAETDIPRVATVDLEPPHCRWPCGDPRETPAHAPLFCGDARVPGAPYCLAHLRRAYCPPQPRRREAPAPVPVLEAV